MKKSAKAKKARKVAKVARKNREALWKTIEETGVFTDVQSVLGDDAVIECPKVLSLNENYLETIDFFRSIKTVARVLDIRSRLGLKADTAFSIGLSKVEHISIRCAVMFTAEVDRLCRVGRVSLNYSGDIVRAHEPLQLLWQLGFFKYLKMRQHVDPDQTVLGHRAAIQIISGLKCPDSEFDEFNSRLNKICTEYQGLAIIEGAMTEAMLNVVHHAYLKEIELEFPHCGHRWWATAAYNEVEREMRFLVYDQGHGIARTLPATGYQDLLMDLYSVDTTTVWRQDSILIEAALKMSRTRTRLDGRGKGFGDIQLPLRLIDGSRLRIVSGFAEVMVRHNRQPQAAPLEKHVGGTLLEWIFPVGSIDMLGGNLDA